MSEDFYIGIIYGFRLDENVVAQVTGASKYRDTNFEKYVHILKYPFDKSNGNDDNIDDDIDDDDIDDIDNSTKIQELEGKVIMTAVGNEIHFPMEPYLSFYTIKRWGNYPNVIDPNVMIQIENTLDPYLIQKTKSWAWSKGLILLSDEPVWFVVYNDSLEM